MVKGRKEAVEGAGGDGGEGEVERGVALVDWDSGQGGRVRARRVGARLPVILCFFWDAVDLRVVHIRMDLFVKINLNLSSPLAQGQSVAARRPHKAIIRSCMCLGR